MNNENLIPYKTKKEAREGGRLGGIKSGEVRRRKRDQRALMAAMLSAKPKLKQNAIDNLKQFGFEGSGEKKDQYTVEMVAVAALLQKVMKGDTRAYRLMLEILGEDGATQREREKTEYESRGIETADRPDDGFIKMLSDQAEGVFADGFDEPKNIDD